MASGIWHLACQTYALSLFNFHGIQNRTQFLFSSPRLSSWLSFLLSLFGFSNLSILLKLPSLVRLVNLLRLPRLSLFFALLLLSYTQSSVALTAHTSRVIEGSGPYLTFDGGRTRATSTDSLLFIKLQDGQVITPSTNTSSVSNPIVLPYVGSTLGNIETLVPSSASSVSLSDLITRYNYWRDDDGDGESTNGIRASGRISVRFKDKNGQTVSRRDALSICSAPYRVTLSSTDGYLQTQYGVPNRTSFRGQTVTYYINPYANVGICYARPNLYFGGTGATVNRIHDDFKYAGPSNIWSPTKGFLTQSTNPLYYNRNFPTTGADGLYFDLLIDGVDASQLTWSPVTRGGITATVRNVIPHDEWIPSIDRGKVVARVRLSGPRASSSQISSSSPSRLTVPSLPQIFELVGRDRSGNEVKYGFVLQKWFVNRRYQGSQYNQLNWCRSLGYRLAKARDLTNAVYTGASSWPISGATPSSSGNYYRRHIGAGFFTEWGATNFYVDLNMVFLYWTGDDSLSQGFDVSSSDGNIEEIVAYGIYGMCTTP
ncbi:hypothetical protein [Gilliamella sp. ESL0254]|uniref:hypothetical protein n=1 Tax=Gilliamella sp. ESL0254 TaxID=2705035 RepID=UPI00157FF9AB|nr:hypothetical protein [Gilliamella sp. ESL0254]NUF27908.1 hypothetical protein [Gilliamella sp. ESL0254]